MIIQMSKKIAAYLCKNGIVPQDELDVYSYSFEMLISTLINTLLLLVVALITHSFFRSFAFAVCFFCLRRVCGGVHATTHFVCISSMMIIYAAFLLLSPFITLSPMMTVLLSACELATVFFLAPVEDFNKPLSTNEIRIYKAQSRMLAVTFAALSLVFLWLKLPQLTIAVQLALVSVCAMLLLGKCKNLFTQRKKV